MRSKAEGDWRTLKEEVVFRFKKYLTVRVDDLITPEGKKRQYGVIERPDFVVVVPRENDGSLYLVRQWRQPIKEKIWELPMGQIDKRETALGAAKRELEEETGLRAGKIEKIGKCAASPGLNNNYAHFFVAQDFSKGKRKAEPMEFGMERKRFSKNQVAKMTRKGAIDAFTAAGLWYYYVGDND